MNQLPKKCVKRRTDERQTILKKNMELSARYSSAAVFCMKSTNIFNVWLAKHVVFQFHYVYRRRK